MAGIATGATSEMTNSFSFTKDGEFLDNHASASITVNADPASALLLANNMPFPAGTTNIGNLQTSVSGGTGNINFAKDQSGVVSFNGSAGFSEGLGVYDDASKLLDDLDPQGTILEGLTINSAGIGQFLVLDWGYNISASASGSVALGGAGSITFGADGSNNGFFALIRGHRTPLGARDAVQDVFGSWMLPGQVKSIDDLQPGTWLIAEVDGQIGLKLGAQYGYNYNWIRKVTLGDGTGALSGDIGLKIQAAADVTLGFNASGKYLVTVARESIDPSMKIVRLRLHKMAKKGWDFALDANVGVTPSTGTLTPAQLSDFVSGLIRGVAGTEGPQIVSDLQQFSKWTDPATPLPDIFSGFVADFITKELSATPLPQQMDQARAKISGFLSQWENLGQTTSTILWSAVEKAGGPLEDLLNFLKQTGGLSTDGLKSLISAELGKVGFSSTPVGQWLQSVATTDLMSLLSDNQQLQQLQKVASTILDIANGKVLDNLIAYVDQKLDIKQIENAISQADFNNLDPWLKSKLSEFLSKNVSFADLDKIRTTIKTIEDKAQQIYTEAVKALNTTYTAAFHYTYASSTTSTALIDVSFDFGQDPALGAFLSAALHGDFTGLLLPDGSGKPDRTGITLGTATLTHGITRQTHVQIALPYFSSTIDELNQALTTMNVQSDGGRLFVYDTKASDTVTLQGKWKSSLTITGKFPVTAGVRNFVTDADLENSMTFSYGFLQATKSMREAQLVNQIEPLVSNYFPNAFFSKDSPDKATVAEWADDLDHFASAVSTAATGGSNGTGNLGDTLFSLDVSLPGKVVAAWFKAPPKNGDQSAYLQMSRNIQVALRRFSAYCYFDDPSKYIEVPSISPIVFYQSLTVLGNFNLDANGNPVKADGIYWDNADPAKVNALLDYRQTQINWQNIAGGIHGVLADSSNLRNKADFYAVPEAWGPRRSEALTNQTLSNLLFAEHDTIKGAQQAGWDIADFIQSAGTDPDKAMAALSNFGAVVTKAFNQGLGGVFGGQAQQRMREFSALIFLEAAKAFDPTLNDVKPLARLDVRLLRPSAPATALTNFLNGTMPDPSIVAIEQPVMGLPGN